MISDFKSAPRWPIVCVKPSSGIAAKAGSDLQDADNEMVFRSLAL
jgi:hypothetical protein